MKTTLDTTEKNKLIAEFMAGKPIETHHNQYHANWNELMPVIKKCFDIEIQDTLIDNNLIGDITHALVDIDIEAAHRAVVELILWKTIF